MESRMERLAPKLRLRCMALVACGMLISFCGCNLLATAMYIVSGANVKAEFKELQGKR